MHYESNGAASAMTWQSSIPHVTFPFVPEGYTCTERSAVFVDGDFQPYIV